MRLCPHCSRVIGPQRRADLVYCQPKCRKAAHRKAIRAPVPLPALSPEMDKVRQDLIAHSTADEIGYQLGWVVDKGAKKSAPPAESPEPTTPQAIWLPSEISRSKRFDGRFDARPYLALRPQFEPPRVPRAA